MKRALLACLFLLITSASAFAQSTTVSGQVTDAGAQSWNNGTFTFTFVPSANNPVGPYTWTGGALSSTIVGSLSGTGSYSVSIPSNTAISPVNSTWTIRFCPQASAGCFTVSNVLITGGTQTVNATPPAIVINLQAIPPPVLAYSTTEVTGAVIGSQFYLLGTALQICSAVSGNNCSTWGSVGSGGVGAGAAPVMAFYLGPNCPVANTGQCFNTPANVRVDNTCTWSNASTTVTCTDTPFASGDVGKQVMGWATCATDLPIANYVGTLQSGTTAMTIATFTDSNHVVLSGTPANTQASAGCFIFGNTDDTGASALDAAYSVQATLCPKILLSGGNYFFSKPHFTAQPPGCSTLPGLWGAVTYGNLDLPDGLEVEGRGAGATVIYLTNNFPNGASKVTNNSITSWFAIPPLGGWKDFQISGGGQAGTCAGMTGGDNIIYMAVAKMIDITLTNFCSIPGNTTGSLYTTVGIYSDLLGQFNRLNMSAFGAKGLQINGTGANSNGVQVAIENTGTMSLDVQAQDTSGRWSFSCFACYLTGSMTYNTAQAGNNFGVVNVAGNAVLRLVNSQIESCPAVGCSVNGFANSPVLLNSAGAGSKMYLDGVVFVNVNSGTNLNTTGGPYCASGKNCTLYARNSIFAHGTSGGSSINSNNNTDVIVDEGGNNFDPTGWVIAAGTTPSVIADGHSLTGTCTGTANASVTNSLYGTGPNITATTCAGQTSTLGTGIPATQARTLSTLICTSTATTVSVACTVMVNGSPSTLTCTMTAATNCKDLTHTVAINKGDLISEKIVTGAAETGANIQMFVMWQ